ncbi:MAG TPA: hypothetical protein VGK36_08870 [Candidatus Angelobacter sp.]|jgi:hypothetical protein
MENKELNQQLKRVESIGIVQDGKLTGEYNFYNYLAALEGKTVRWTLEVADGNNL